MKTQYAAVDWLTMTTQDERVGQNWWALYQKYKGVRRNEGNEEKNFHNGFYSGVRTASMSVGYSDRIGYIVVVSGSDAERLFRRLQPGKHKVTRIDLCIDTYYEKPRPLAKQLYQRLHKEHKNKQRRYSLFEASDGGMTFYLGSRQSMQFGRVYDKGIQTGKVERGKLWRAEVEYKKPISGSIARGLAEQSSEDRELVVCDTVGDWFFDRGAGMFPPKSASEALHISVEARITTATKKLAWLRSQVAPSVTELIALGYGRDVLNVLSLDIEAISEALASKH